MAGHSAFLSLDGPVQVIGPTGVLVTPGVHPYDLGALSELMKYSVKPLKGPEPTTSAGPNTVFATLISVPLGLALAAAACVVEACAAPASPTMVARVVRGTSARQMGLTDMKSSVHAARRGD